MKKAFNIILVLVLILGISLPTAAFAEGESFDLYFTFDKEFYEVGETVTAQVHLDRTDGDADYTMYYFDGGVLFNPLYLEYNDSSENANNAKGMRIAATANYHNMTLNLVSIKYHGLTNPETRSAKLTVAELQFTALKKISEATLYHYNPSVSAAANTAALLNSTNGTYVIGNPDAPKFAVSFAAGAEGISGSAPAAVEDKAEGDAMVLPACSWTRTGYTFAGWSDGTADYKVGDEFTMPAAAVSFTAQWTMDPVKRNISFTIGSLSEGATAAGAAPDARQLFPGEKMSMPTQGTLVVTGYSFQGWGLGDTTLQPGDIYTVPDGDTVFAALWKSIETGAVMGGGGSVSAAPAVVPAIPVETPVAPVDSWTNPFSDVSETDWFYESVREVTQAGLMEGTSSTTFAPNVNMNRAMLVTVLYRIAGKPAVDTASPFSDVAQGVWYTEAVTWASEQKLVEGYAAPSADAKGLFGPADPLTRQQMITLLWRWNGSPAPAGTIDPAVTFTDWANVADWAKVAMAWAAENGYVEGMSDGSVAPMGIATRAQCAALLNRILP